ncbi:hypothetical protein [Roseobacter sp. OBYS 0001]|uniref:hypothetical protein n=1 Tax=Roseobacter sp. OBYS 0001 TaxID=882651 RepID=UPI001BBB80A8|nr:hypothetical protein [Roseobacter sp. OBYS 0001]GIT85981.1 hypothetical protein ROBYS_09970 [Roseobacter sp. OBYS 0001]
MTVVSSKNSTPPGLVLRFGILIAVIVLATWGVHMIRDALDIQIRPDNEQQVHKAIMIGVGAYIVFLSMPFVPSAEIGVALLAGFGAAIAPLIYVCTVTAMMLAFTIGRFLPIGMLERLFRVLRLGRAADLVARAAPLSKDERLAMFLEGQSKRAVSTTLQYRYVALAVAVNMPGNSLIGGGGGIMIVAGLSGIFAPFATFLTILIAVSPVPLAVMFLGLQF